MSVGNPHFAAMELGSTPLSLVYFPCGESRPCALGEKNTEEQDRGGQDTAPSAPSGMKSSESECPGCPGAMVRSVGSHNPKFRLGLGIVWEKEILIAKLCF